MQPAQRRRRRFAELGAVGAGHAAEMGEAEIEGDIDDARVGGSALQLGVEMRQADIQQHLGNRSAEMPLKTELQRADADACCLRELFEIERIGGMSMQAIPRPPQCTRQGLAST